MRGLSKQYIEFTCCQRKKIVPISQVLWLHFNGIKFNSYKPCKHDKRAEQQNNHFMNESFPKPTGINKANVVRWCRNENKKRYTNASVDPSDWLLLSNYMATWRLSAIIVCRRQSWRTWLITHHTWDVKLINKFRAETGSSESELILWNETGLGTCCKYWKISHMDWSSGAHEKQLSNSAGTIWANLNFRLAAVECSRSPCRYRYFCPRELSES